MATTLCPSTLVHMMPADILQGGVYGDCPRSQVIAPLKRHLLPREEGFVTTLWLPIQAFTCSCHLSTRLPFSLLERAMSQQSNHRRLRHQQTVGTAFPSEVHRNGSKLSSVEGRTTCSEGGRLLRRYLITPPFEEGRGRGNFDTARLRPPPHSSSITGCLPSGLRHAGDSERGMVEVHIASYQLHSFEEQFANMQRGRFALTAPDPRRRRGHGELAVGRGVPLQGLACAIGQLVDFNSAGSERPAQGKQHLFIAHCSILPQTLPRLAMIGRNDTSNLRVRLDLSQDVGRGSSKIGRDARSCGFGGVEGRRQITALPRIKPRLRNSIPIAAGSRAPASVARRMRRSLTKCCFHFRSAAISNRERTTAQTRQTARKGTRNSQGIQPTPARPC
ncbi:hypothetical protein B0T14DRAFT_84954 [Immersiella caudata]|uniref:Uncharacterized protein n=1 Tax=Immersiella caudata TaxID=314043 RepID=A0AA39XI17_9PEZI|nr:hypothetical protein B0T14DRAFT_84954 [Immersiella caudata]